MRTRAYELFCERSRRATALDDWIEAEHEVNLLHLCGIEDDGDGFRITGCVPHDCGSNLAIDVLPQEIVVEALTRDGVKRYTRCRMPAPIDTSRVAAYLKGFELEVTAPKATAH